MLVLILSPHRDDAAFSCGLTVHALLNQGATVGIVNVCTRSRYAPYHSSAQGDPLEEISAVRRSEDEAFATLLASSSGAAKGSVFLHDLNWLDAPDRWCMNPEGSLERHSIPASEVESLQQDLRALPAADLVMVPLALGGHVDHRLVHEAAAITFAPDRLLFYEDLPYACRSRSYEQAISATLVRAQSGVMPGKMLPGVKEACARCYPSQVDGTVAIEMEAYTASLGGERFFGGVEVLARLTHFMRDEEERF